ncbi:hypothetical protein D3C72_2359910 [compost metagenome]
MAAARAVGTGGIHEPEEPRIRASRDVGRAVQHSHYSDADPTQQFVARDCFGLADDRKCNPAGIGPQFLGSGRP